MRRNAVAFIVVTASLALSAAACGSNPSPSAGRSASPGGPNSSGQVAFSRCVRSHGVPNFPDPSASGEIPKDAPQQLGVTASRLEAAQRACSHLLPISQPTPAVRQQVLAQSVRFSQCVRTHGVPNFPDPAGNGRIPDPASLGINQGSPQFQSANKACGKWRPPYIPSNAAYDSWAATHGS